MLNKKQLIILAVVILVLIFAGTFSWFSQQKTETSQKGEITGEQVKREEAQEVYSLSGVIASINVENNFLMVKPANQEKEVKVILSDSTKLIKLEFPFDPENPPEGATFTPKMVPITAEDLKVGDNLLVESTLNIYGKDEFDNVSQIQVLP